MFMRLLLCCSLLLSLLPAAEIPDGKWNGKPWPRAELTRKAEAGDPHAMAEWAFDAWLMSSDLPYEPEKIVSYAQRSAAEGSLLGKTMLGVFQREGFYLPMNAPEGAKLVMEAAAAGHPHAMHLQSRYMLRGIYDGQQISGVPADLPAALKLHQQAKKLGALASVDIEWRMAIWGADGVVDMEAAYRGALLSIETGLSNGTLDNLNFAIRGKKHPLHVFLKPEDIKSIQEKMKEAAAKGHEGPRYRIETMNLRNISFYRSGSNFNIGFPELLKAANAGFYPANSSTLFLLHRRTYQKRDTPLPFGCSENGLNDFFRHVYENGCWQDTDWIASNYFDFKSEEVAQTGKIDTAIIADLRRRFQNSGDAEYIYILGYYLAAANRTLKDAETARRARNLCIMASIDYKYAKYQASVISRSNECLGEDHMITWAAALKATIEDPPEHFHRVVPKWFHHAKKTYQDKYENHFTPEQREKVDALIAENYPTADKFRRAAYEALQKSGDMPAGVRFEDYDRQLSGGERKHEDEAAPAEEVFHEASPPSPFLPQTSLIADTRTEVLGRYLAGEPLQATDVPALTALFLSESEELRQLLASAPESARRAEVTRLLEAVTEPDEAEHALGAGLGWWIVIKDRQPTSLPFIFLQKKDSLASRSGLLEGDVIDACNGLSLIGPESRNRLTQVIRLWPAELPLELSIRRAKKPKGAKDMSERSERKAITIHFQ